MGGNQAAEDNLLTFFKQKVDLKDSSNTMVENTSKQV